MNFHEVRFPAALSVGLERRAGAAHRDRHAEERLRGAQLALGALAAALRRGARACGRWTTWPSSSPSSRRGTGSSTGSAGRTGPTSSPARPRRRRRRRTRRSGPATGRDARSSCARPMRRAAQSYVRPIAKPVAGTVRVAVAGVRAGGGPASRSIAATGRVQLAAPPADGRAGDGRVRVRRAGALRHATGSRRASPGSRRARCRRSRWSRCGSDARDRSGAAGAAGRRRDAALPLLAGAPAGRQRARASPTTTGTSRFDGVVFRASSGMDASALQSATGLSVDNAQAVGALSERRGQRGGHPGGAVRRGGDLAVAGGLGAARAAGADVPRALRRDPAVGRRLRGGAARAGGGAERAGRAVGAADLRPGARGREVRVRRERSRGSPARAWWRGRAGASIVGGGLGGFAAGWFTHGALTWLTGANAGEKAAVKVDRPGDGRGARPDALAGAGAAGRGGRPVPGGGRDATSGRRPAGRSSATCSIFAGSRTSRATTG